jgi:hypothetical protein
VFIYSPRAEALYLRVEGPLGRPRSGITVAVSPAHGILPAVMTGPSGRVEVAVSSGVTEVTLVNPHPVASAPAVTGVHVVAGPG